MKRFLFIIVCCFLLSGCASKAPSQSLVENTRREVATVQETIKKIETQTPPECKTEVFMSDLMALKHQVSSIGGQIESIGLSCVAEKETLQERINSRDMTIVCLVLLIVGLVYVLVRRR